MNDIIKLLRVFVAEILFHAGHRMVRWSATLSGFDEVAKSLKDSKPKWFDTD